MPHHQITVEFSSWLPEQRAYTVEDAALTEREADIFSLNERFASAANLDNDEAARAFDDPIIIKQLNAIRGVTDVFVCDDGLWVHKKSDAQWGPIDFGIKELLCKRFDWDDATIHLSEADPGQFVRSFYEELKGLTQLAFYHQVAHLMKTSLWRS